VLNALLVWDERLFRLLNEAWLHPILDRLLPFVSDARTFTLPLIMAAIVIVLVGRMRGLRFLVLAVVSVVVADAIGTHIFKYSLLRARPCIALADVRLLVGCTSLPSFPSNHAVNASVLAALATLHMPRLWLPAMAVAFLVGYSRVYVGAHYPLDVLAGSMLGIVVALAFSGVMNFLWPLSSGPVDRPRIFSLKIGSS
jgi:undecaprenyl-diphosphatase